MPINIHKAYRTSIILDQKIKSSHYIINKTLNLQNKVRLLKGTSVKAQVVCQSKLIRITPTSQQRLKKPEGPGQMYDISNRPQMSSQTTILFQISNHHRWIKQYIPQQNQI